jgi:hypothetical protein
LHVKQVVVGSTLIVIVVEVVVVSQVDKKVVGQLGDIGHAGSILNQTGSSESGRQQWAR